MSYGGLCERTVTVAVSIALVAACGSGSESGSDSTPSSTGAPTTAAAAVDLAGKPRGRPDLPVKLERVMTDPAAERPPAALPQRSPDHPTMDATHRHAPEWREVITAVLAHTSPIAAFGYIGGSCGASFTTDD